MGELRRGPRSSKRNGSEVAAQVVAITFQSGPRPQERLVVESGLDYCPASSIIAFVSV